MTEQKNASITQFHTQINPLCTNINTKLHFEALSLLWPNYSNYWPLSPMLSMAYNTLDLLPLCLASKKKGTHICSI